MILSFSLLTQESENNLKGLCLDWVKCYEMAVFGHGVLSPGPPYISEQLNIEISLNCFLEWKLTFPKQKEDVFLKILYLSQPTQ